MSNADTRLAREFHAYTKHSSLSVRQNPHWLDWDNQPHPYKIYPDAPEVNLPRDFDPPAADTFEAISGIAPHGGRLDLPKLARILYFTYGITRTKVYGDRQIEFRACAGAGALYPTELYVVARHVEGVTPGLYHFNPGDFKLRRLREGDFGKPLVTATGGEPAVVDAPAIIVETAIFWRSTWKYQDRAYRYVYWDAGMVTANLLAVATSEGLGARVITAFLDQAVDRLLGIDGEREGTLCLVAIGGDAPSPADRGDLTPLPHHATPLSAEEVDYPALRRVHRACFLEEDKEVQSLRGAAAAAGTPPAKGRLFTLRIPSSLHGPPLGPTIIKRGSTRKFGRVGIEFNAFSVILDRASRGVPMDVLAREGDSTLDLYVIVNDVEELPPGAYYYRRGEDTLELLKEGEFRADAGHLGLGQPLPGDAAACVFFLADLERVLSRLGNRGYRVAQLEAGIMGGKMYLAAFAQDIGATGLTFYDDDVITFFSPHASGKEPIFLMAFGIPKSRAAEALKAREMVSG